MGLMTSVEFFVTGVAVSRCFVAVLARHSANDGLRTKLRGSVLLSVSVSRSEWSHWQVRASVNQKLEESGEKEK
eukprot:1642939-Rhodomonas_salina.1